nr:MAG TPA: hypothetical protein [Caudoviricetes sp.]
MVVIFYVQNVLTTLKARMEKQSTDYKRGYIS